mmetsp:Transcript_36555/g.117222  ORF Transcript_36555/g.117222 Transcript_36555/m.117222 type:complete len:658 (-) Transcript_36555:153-2126(-)
MRAARRRQVWGDDLRLQGVGRSTRRRPLRGERPLGERGSGRFSREATAYLELRPGPASGSSAVRGGDVPDQPDGHLGPVQARLFDLRRYQENRRVRRGRTNGRAGLLARRPDPQTPGRAHGDHSGFPAPRRHRGIRRLADGLEETSARSSGSRGAKKEQQQRDLLLLLFDECCGGQRRMRPPLVRHVLFGNHSLLRERDPHDRGRLARRRAKVDHHEDGQRGSQKGRRRRSLFFKEKEGHLRIVARRIHPRRPRRRPVGPGSRTGIRRSNESKARGIVGRPPGRRRRRRRRPAPPLRVRTTGSLGDWSQGHGGPGGGVGGQSREGTRPEEVAVEPFGVRRPPREAHGLFLEIPRAHRTFHRRRRLRRGLREARPRSTDAGDLASARQDPQRRKIEPRQDLQEHRAPGPHGGPRPPGRHGRPGRPRVSPLRARDHHDRRRRRRRSHQGLNLNLLLPLLHRPHRTGPRLHRLPAPLQGLTQERQDRTAGPLLLDRRPARRYRYLLKGRPALQRPRRNDARAALGHHHGPHEAQAPEGPHRRRQARLGRRQPAHGRARRRPQGLHRRTVQVHLRQGHRCMISTSGGARDRQKEERAASRTARLFARLSARTGWGKKESGERKIKVTRRTPSGASLSTMNERTTPRSRLVTTTSPPRQLGR